MTKTISNRAAARAAKEQGIARFTAVCKQHGETEFYASNSKCVACMSANAAKRFAKKVSTPEGREAHNSHSREVQRRLYKDSTSHRGQQREGRAARAWRRATGGSLTGLYELEREALRSIYGACRDEFEIDHATPKVSYGPIGGKRERIVTGLHCRANLVETPKRVNREKRSQFAPETNRLQRPANRYPGGAFDPQPTKHEQALIDQAKALGTPAKVSLKVLREALDAKATEYERYTASVLVRLLSEVAA